MRMFFLNGNIQQHRRRPSAVENVTNFDQFHLIQRAAKRRNTPTWKCKFFGAITSNSVFDEVFVSGKNVKSDQSHSIQRQTKRKDTSTWKYRKFFELQHPTASTTSKSGRKCHQFWLVSFDSACDETLKYPNLKIQNFWRHYIHQRLGHGRHYFLTVIRRINNAGCHWYLQSHLPAR